MKEIYLEVKEPGMVWSRVGGQSYDNEVMAIMDAQRFNRSPILQEKGFKYRAVKVEPVVIGGWRE